MVLYQKYIFRTLAILLMIIASSNTSFAIDFYWKSTNRPDNIFTNIGNWESAPGSGLAPSSVAPTSSDNVIFPAGNLTQNITIPASGATVRNITILSGGVITFIGQGTLNVFGDLVSNGNLMISNNTLTFQGAGNHIINMGTNSVRSAPTNTINFNGSGTYTLQGDVNLASRINVSNTSFVANGFALTCAMLYINPTTVTGLIKNINFANSKLTVYSGASTSSLTGGLVFAAQPASTTYNFNNAEIIMDQKSKDCTLAATFEASGTTLSGLKSLTFKENSPNLVPNDVENISAFTVETTDLNINVASFNLQNTNLNFNVTNLNFAQPTYYTATNTHNLRVKALNEFASCVGQSFITSIGSTNINFIAEAPISTTNVAFKRINFSNNTVSFPLQNDLGQNTGTFSTSATIPNKSFYWVGGTGNWNDPTMWSLIGSGGTAQAANGCLPTLNDDVYFDNNSFTANSQVTVLGGGNPVANVRNLFWTDANRRANLVGGIININGSADFSGARGVSSTINFIGGNTNHTFNPGSLTYTSPSVNFTGIGTYTLMADFIGTGEILFNLFAGSFKSGGFDITAFAFDGRSQPSTDDNLRNVDISGSTLNFVGDANNTVAFNLSTSRLNSFTAINSIINISGVNGVFNVIGSSGTEPKLNTIAFHNINFTEGNSTARMASSVLNFSANDVYFASNANIQSTNTTATAVHLVNNYNLTPAKTYQFQRSSTLNPIYSIGNSINSNSIGVCSPKITINSSTTGLAARLSKTSLPFTINNAVVRDINAIASTLTVVGGQDLGNNTNVNITPSPTQIFYWVGGTGNWNDASHWSIGVSGGNPTVTNTSNCVPSVSDDVFFDGNSFTANGQIVTIDGSAFARNVTWANSAGAKTPVLAGAQTSTLNVFGSIIFAPNMTSTFTGSVDMRGNAITQNTNSINTNNVSLSNTFLFTGGGRYDLLSNITTSRPVDFTLGQIFTNSNNITASRARFTATGTNFVNISNSIITVGSFGNGFGLTISTASQANIDATGSTLIANGFDSRITLSTSSIINYNKIISGVASVGNSSTLSASNVVVNEVTFISPINSISGNPTIGTLTVPTASTNTLTANQTLTITDKVIANGTSCNSTEFKSSIPGTQAIITSANCNLDLKFVRLTDLRAGSCTAAQNKVIGDNVSNNTNFTFLNTDNVEYLGPDVTLACNGFPYVLNTTGFGTNVVSYLWGDGSTGSTLNVNGPGTYKVTVRYGKDCTLSDEIVIGLSTSVVLNPATLTACGDAGGNASFNLTAANAQLVATPANYTFTYYATAAHASAGTNAINANYTGNASSVFVRAVEIAGGCFSTGEIKLNIGNGTPPTASATQKICAAGTYTLANIAINGENIKWYADNTTTTALPTNTNLTNGSTYYATQTVTGGCESTRVAIKIILENCAFANPALRSRGKN